MKDQLTKLKVSLEVVVGEWDHLNLEGTELKKKNNELT